MSQLEQPSIFISHGTIYEAFKSDQLKSDFVNIRNEYLKTDPSAIVIFSGHWKTEIISVTTSEKMVQLNEGFPPEFQTNYQTVGHPVLANRIIEMLDNHEIECKEDRERSLDHGALIPLLLLFPNGEIPVVQVSLQYNLDPNYHKKIAKVLAPLRKENILFLGSGGLVHNRNEIQKFGGHEIEPDSWAKEFDDFITAELADTDDEKYIDKIIAGYNHKLFYQCHPTREHYLPLVIATAFGGQPKKIYESFQWKNLSMSSFLFE